MKKLILKLFMVAILAVMSSLDAFSVCNASFVKTINGLTVNFQNRSTYDYSPNYYWIFGDGTFSTAKDPIKTYATTGVKSVRLYVSDSSGGNLMCASTVLDTFILISGTPTCQASFYGSVSQVSLSVNFYNYSSSSSGSVLHYLWNFPDNTTSTLRQPTKSFTTGGLKVVKLTITDSATSCTSSITDTLLLVGNNCVANFTKAINGLTVTLSNTSLNGNSTTAGLSYNWSFSEGPNSYVKNPVKTFTSNGIKFIRLQIFDSITNCTKIKTDSFFLGPCQASFSKTITGLIVNLNNTSINGNGNTAGLVYNWSFSEGPNTSVKNPVKSFSSYGIKFIHLQIFDSITNCTSTKTDSFNLVAVPSNCQASFVIEPWHSQTYYFRNTSTYTSGHTHFLWSFSDSTTSTAFNAGKTYTSYGMKTIRLTLIDSSTLCTSTFIDTIYINPGTCNSRFYASTNGLTVNFYNSNNPSNVNYYWSFGDGTYSTQINPIKTYASAGPKYVRLTVSDTMQTCYSVYDSTIVVNNPTTCNASFSYSANWLNVIFSNKSTSSAGGSNLHYLWNFSDGTTSTAINPSKAFATGGFKIVTLYIYDSSTSCSSSYTDTLLLNSGGNNCVSNFTRTISGLTVNFNNSSLNGNGTTAGLAYYWSFSEGPNSYVKNPTKIFSSSGVKWAQLQIFDSITNCNSLKIDSFLLSPSSNCLANFNKSVNGLTVNLNNSSTNTNGLPAGLTYNWNFGDGTTSTQKDPVKTYASGGPKIIQLTISDSLQSCYSTKYDSVFLVAPTPLCSASFTLAIDTTTPFHFYLLNTSLVRTNSTFLWNFGDGSSSTSMTPSHTYANFGTYLVCLTVSDSLCTSMFCDSVGMDSTGILLKGGAFGFQTLDFTTKAGSNGIAQEFGSNQYAIYPNPSNAIFNVEVDLKSASPITYQVADISGKIVLTKSMMAPSGKHAEAIDLSNVQSSIYFLSISSNDGISTHKIIKN